GVQGRTRGRLEDRPGALGGDLPGGSGRHGHIGREYRAGATQRDSGGKPGEHRRSSGRQGLSRGADVGVGQRDVAGADLHSGTETQINLEVERPTERRTTRGDGQSSASAWRAEQETAATA